MTRIIKYKPISPDLEKIVKPATHSDIRASLGLEGAVGEFFYINIEDLVPFHNQARRDFNEQEILSLADSIKGHGIRQPLTVQRFQDKYEVVSGERRLRAAKLAGLEKVPCIIINQDSQADAIALIENIHRKDLHPVELGIAYKNLLENGIFKNQSELAEKISINKSKVSEYVKFGSLESTVQQFILTNKITSRAKLRRVLKSYEKGDYQKIKEIIGMIASSKKIPIIRIISTETGINVEDKGISKLSTSEKNELKQCLIHLLEKCNI